MLPEVWAYVWYVPDEQEGVAAVPRLVLLVNVRFIGERIVMGHCRYEHLNAD